MAGEDTYKDRNWFPYANLITPIYEMDISEDDKIMVAFYQSTKEFHGYMNDGKKPAKTKEQETSFRLCLPHMWKTWSLYR